MKIPGLITGIKGDYTQLKKDFNRARKSITVRPEVYRSFFVPKVAKKK